MDNKEDTVVNFTNVLKEVKEKESFLTLGKEAFNEKVKEADSFLAIIFDAQDTPQVIWAGEIDPFDTIDSLDAIKNIFIDNLTN